MLFIIEFLFTVERNSLAAENMKEVKRFSTLAKYLHC